MSDDGKSEREETHNSISPSSKTFGLPIAQNVAQDTKRLFQDVNNLKVSLPSSPMCNGRCSELGLFAEGASVRSVNTPSSRASSIRLVDDPRIQFWPAFKSFAPNIDHSARIEYHTKP